ncbi:MAG: DNA polymerase III subunit alpha [Sodaliphilus sp.]|nr:DNA polymerase III subunit alpha [Sodaliphilus sp.]
MIPFVHLHVHSYYSILDGQAPVTKLVDKAIADGMRGMALTDHGNMFGIKELHDYCNGKNKDTNKRIKELKKQIKELEAGEQPEAEEIERLKSELEETKRKLFIPIFGCETYVADGKLTEHKDKSDKGRHLILLAKNEKGYHNLIKIVSKAWTDGFYAHPRTDHDELARDHEGLICSSACLGGEIPRLIMNGEVQKAKEVALWYKGVFGDDYYLEIQRHKATVPNANHETYEKQQQVNKVLIDMAHELGIKLICTNDSHFVNEDDAEAHDHLLCLATGKDLNDPNRMLYSKQEWFKTQEEMNEVFADVPEALANTQEIVDKVEIYNIDHDPIMPFFPIPESFGTEEQWRKKFTEEDLYKEFCSDENGENMMSEADAMKRINHLGGYDKIYRIKFELHVMKTMGFPGYFLIVQDFINAARDELGVMVGPGRGSAAGSVVAYCLGITKIDPLKYDLLFERFLNPDRISLPDIDTDFDDDGRGKVLRWVMDKYGAENCAHIITYATMATKNSIKDVARVEKLPLDRSNALCKAIPDKLPDGMKMNLPNAIKCTPELQTAESSQDPRERNTIKYAKKLEGTIRGTGIHACGFIICRDRIDDHVPVSTATDPDFPELKTAVTQYDGHVIESTGLIKMDFLGLKTLSELKEACKVVKQTTGDVVDLDHIPIDDPLTYKLYQEGRTIGTFQFESPGMQKYLKELHPTVFEDLIAMNALYRPGPMEYIPDFIKRKHDPSLVQYDIPCMEKYLKDTYGITVYQEQVMLLSRQLANFTRGESDALRKAMGKKKKAIVDAMKPKFIEQGTANGHDPKVLDKIWSDWEKFASYAFNKSHATCYSWVSYQTAYMKAHYPAEFMAALMTRRFSQITEITKLMEECQSMGIKTLGPDVNESYPKFGVNEKGEIRFGLSAIKGMGEAAAEAIVNERLENGPYKDIFDFAQRTNYANVNRKAFESLAVSGGFDSFGIERECFFATNEVGTTFLDMIVKYGQQYQAGKRDSEYSLFGGIEEIEIPKPKIPQATPWAPIVKLDKEKELIGVYLSAHPLDPYYVEITLGCNVAVSEVKDKASFLNQELRFGGIVTDSKECLNQKGKPYGRMTISDYTGSYELMLFGQNYYDYMKYAVKGTAVLVKAMYSKGKWGDKVWLEISSITPLDSIKNSTIEKVMLQIDESQIKNISEVLDDCKIPASRGGTSLYIKLQNADTGANLELKSDYNIKLDKSNLVRIKDLGVNCIVDF